MPPVSEVLNMVPAEDRPALRDHDLRTTCRCGNRMDLAQALVDRFPDQPNASETAYRCPRCHETLLVVCAPGYDSWQGRGWRTGNWVIRNARELTYTALGGGVGVIPACPHALD